LFEGLIEQGGIHDAVNQALASVVEQKLVVLPESLRKRAMEPGALEAMKPRVKIFPAQKPIWQRLGDIESIDEMLTSVGRLLWHRLQSRLESKPRGDLVYDSPFDF
jgi:hypothetical protein